MLRIATILISCSVALLVAIGMVMLASTSFWVASPENPLSLFNKQVGILIAALASGFLLMLLSPSQIRAVAMPLFIFGLLCLIACYIPGIRVNRGGAFRWIDLPLLPQFQPSEIGKITTLIGLAAFFASHTAEIGRFFRGFVLPSIIVCVPVMLIFFEEDMDTALALGLVCMLTMWCIGTRSRYVIPSAVIAICGVIFLISLSENRMRRINSFTQLEDFPTSDKKIQDVNRQQWHALLGYGTGGLHGEGLGNSRQKHGFLAEAHTDFILPVVGEELGLKYTLGVLFCYVGLGLGGLIVAMHAKQVFERALATGLTLIILVPAMINIAVTTGSCPNAGLPLPFISYGGTNLMFSIWSIALLLGINRQNIIQQAKTGEAFIPTPVPMKL